MESLNNKQPPPQPITLFGIVIKFVFAILFISGIAGIALLGHFFSPSINELSSYTVTSATVDPFNISSLQLTAAWNISIYIKNYKLKSYLYFDRVQSSIYYGSYLLSQVSIPSFYVQSRWHKTLHDRLMARSKSLDVDVAESMVRDRLLHGAVDFRVELLARARYSMIFDNGYKYSISCENVTLGFPAGRYVGPRRKCNVLVDGKTNNKGWN